jgi:3-isopropylmalate/(R)-2-methylmalate dehydratase small subunit
MERFRTLNAAALPIERPNVDTDQIIPARFLSRPREKGLAEMLFRDIRFDEDGDERPDFVLNQDPYRTARIVVAQRNFGCGSSRENAVWALHDYGFRAAIAPSFGDIFANNCLKNGMLPVVLPEETVAALLTQIREQPGATIEVDLSEQLVTGPDGARYHFEIDPFAKACLLEGRDEIGYTLSLIKQIEAFENRYGRHNSRI